MTAVVWRGAVCDQVGFLTPQSVVGAPKVRIPMAVYQPTDLVLMKVTAATSTSSVCLRCSVPTRLICQPHCRVPILAHEQWRLLRVLDACLPTYVLR